MILTELHFHTAESSRCGKVPVKQGLTMYKEAGYDAVVVTDHFSRNVCGKAGENHWEQVVERFLAGYRAAVAEGEKLGLSIFLGMELRFPFDDNDFLVYGLDEEDLFSHPWLYESCLASVHEQFSRESVAIFQAHPFRSVCSPADPGHIDGVEILNGNQRHDSHNDLARAWAEEHGLPGICGSDFHHPEDLTGIGVRLNALPVSGRDLARMLTGGEFVRQESPKRS